MKTFICILRGINVGGKRKIIMADLKVLMHRLGLANIETYIQSGNVIFDAKESNLRKMEEQIKAMISSEFGFDVPVIIREKSIFLELIESCPYKIDDVSIKHVHLTFIGNEPQLEDVVMFKKITFKGEQLVFVKGDIILKCGDRYSQAKFNNGFIEKKLKTTATTRNWKTVLKLKELLCKR